MTGAPNDAFATLVPSVSDAWLCTFAPRSVSFVFVFFFLHIRTYRQTSLQLTSKLRASDSAPGVWLHLQYVQGLTCPCSTPWNPCQSLPTAPSPLYTCASQASAPLRRSSGTPTRHFLLDSSPRAPLFSKCRTSPVPQSASKIKNHSLWCTGEPSCSRDWTVWQGLQGSSKLMLSQSAVA